MTIRQMLRRRILYWYTALFVAVAGGWIFGPMQIESIDGSFPLALVGVGGALAGGLIYMFLAFRCPRCTGNLWATVQSLALPWGRRDRVSYCHYCGCSLSERWHQR
jgi:hypothetical protein